MRRLAVPSLVFLGLSLFGTQETKEKRGEEGRKRRADRSPFQLKASLELQGCIGASVENAAIPHGSGLRSRNLEKSQKG